MIHMFGVFSVLSLAIYGSFLLGIYVYEYTNEYSSWLTLVTQIQDQRAILTKV